MTEECYMCRAEGVSEEHCPPKCLFPSDKRIGLATVYSCVAHNNDKSEMDTYLRDFFAACYKTSKKVPKSVVGKFVNSFRDKKKEGKFFLEPTPALVDDKPSVVFTLQKEKLLYSIECVTKGLFYRDFGVKLEGDLKMSFPDMDKRDPSFETLLREAVDISFWEDLEHIPYKGRHPEIFKYRFSVDGQFVHCQMVFYGAFSIYAVRNE